MRTFYYTMLSDDDLLRFHCTFVGLYVMAIFYQDYDIQFTEACRSRMWGSLALWFSGKDFIIYPIIFCPYSDAWWQREKWSISFKVTSLWPTPFAKQQTKAETKGVLANSGGKREKKGWSSNNHDPELIIYFPRIKLFPEGKKFSKIMWFGKSQNEERV